MEESLSEERKKANLIVGFLAILNVNYQCIGKGLADLVFLQKFFYWTFPI